MSRKQQYPPQQQNKNNQYNQYNQYNQQNQFQAQQFKQIQAQKQEMIYMMQEDLTNMIGVIADTQASLDYFRHNPDHQYAAIALNRLTLQTNLSNGIVADLQRQAQVSNLNQDLLNLKNEMAIKFQQTIDLSKLDPKIKEIAENYLKVNLNQHTVQQELKQKDVGIKAEFNQDVVQKVIGGMQQVDRQVEKIRDGEQINTVEYNQLKIHFQNRYKTAQEKLQQNYNQAQKWDQSQVKQNGVNHQNNFPNQNGKMEEEQSLNDLQNKPNPTYKTGSQMKIPAGKQSSTIKTGKR